MSKERPWNENQDQTPFSVTLWMSHPEQENDDCYSGVDFATEAEARVCFANPQSGFGFDISLVPFIMLDGPGLMEVTERVLVRKQVEKDERDYQRMARNEVAMQAGMGMGVHAYNDAMGADSEPYDEAIHGDNEWNQYMRDQRDDQ